MNEIIKKPKKLHRPKPYLLQSEWEDGSIYTIKIQTFRDKCPCAECSGEAMPSIDGQNRFFAGLNTMKPGKYELKSLKAVGNYGVQPAWGDGHDAGLYTWDILLDIFVANNLTQEEIDELDKKSANATKN
ncbi:MAG: hypothetical protein A2X64_09315 [Ignavibacteria bacterium GWF2_33_9]|nr:MAG: hypothetical protein A2X64_09315 [Ignavibacteria bacterium GWF2_33_9]